MKFLKFEVFRKDGGWLKWPSFNERIGKTLHLFSPCLPLSPLKVAKTHSSRTSFFWGKKCLPYFSGISEKTFQVAQLPGDMAKLVSMSFLDIEVNPAPKIIISSQNSQGSKQFFSLKYMKQIYIDTWRWIQQKKCGFQKDFPK